MAGQGPPPKPAGTRARRNAAPQTRTLGARTGVLPPWPLRPDRALSSDKLKADRAVERLRGELDDADDRRTIARLKRELDEAVAEAEVLDMAVREAAEDEQAMWAELWQTPQATMWETNGWHRDVALYVRYSLQAAQGDLKAAAEERQRSDRLGLNPLALMRLRWEIERTGEAQERGQRRRRTAAAEQTAPPAAKSDGEAPRDPRQAFRVVSGGKG